MPGTYRKRGNDSYRLEVCIGTDYRGKPIRYSKTVHCKSNKEAEKELARFYTECENGTVSRSSNITVADLCDLYIKEDASVHLKKSTLLGVKTAINVAIKPYYDTKKASKIKKIDVQQWINDLYNNPDRKQKLSPKTIRNYFSVFRSVMQFGVIMELISKNPCQDIKLPKPEHKEANYYSKDEVEMLLKGLESAPYSDLKFKVAIYIALFGGLRKGEILGLNWDDVDWDGRRIRIQRTRMIDRGNGIYEDTPKTDKSKRVITLPEEVMQLLRELKLQQKTEQVQLGSKWIYSPAILKGQFGQPMYPQVLQRWFSKFLLENGLRNIGLHGLRHTHTSMLAFLQKDKMQISKRLGHSQLSTTLNIYTHLFDDSDLSIADDLSVAFFQKTRENI